MAIPIKKPFYPVVTSQVGPPDPEHNLSIEARARTVKDDELSNAISAVGRSLSLRIDVASAAGGGGVSVVSAVSFDSTSLEQAISAMSNSLSVEQAVRAAADAALSLVAAGAASDASNALSVASAATLSVVALSNAISNEGSVRLVSVQVASAAAAAADTHAWVASAAATSADNHAAVASAAATSADNHANTVSVRAVSISAELVSLVQIASAAATSADSHAAAASAAATSADAHANTASAAATSADGHANTVSARAASISAELVSLVQIASAAATSVDGHVNTVSNALSNEISNRISAVQVASAAATSADGHANTASAAATSADNHANTVSVRAVSISAELASLVQIASAAATSADGHANTVSARAVSISAELASLVQIASAAATSADGHANAASAAATSVDTRLNTLSNLLSALSVRSVGNVSTKGLQSVLNAISNRISVGDQTASAAATSADGHANTVSVRAVSISAELASLVQIASAAATSADGHANTVSVRAVSISAELASLVQIASAAATSADNHANTVSARAVSISAELNSLLNSAAVALSLRINGITPGGGSATPTSNQFSALTASVRVNSDNISVEIANRIAGDDALSNTLSAGGVLINTISNLLSNTISNATSVSAALETHINTVSARGTSISAELASLVQIASAAATSVDARATSINALLISLSVRNTAGTSVKGGVQSIINAISNKISAVSNRVSAVDATILNAAPFNLRYTFAADTSATDPGSVLFKVNNATFLSATSLYFSYTAFNALQTQTWWASLNAYLATGNRAVIVLHAVGSSVVTRFRITGALIDHTTWGEYPITVDVDNVVPSVGVSYVLAFFPSDTNISDLYSANAALSLRITSAEANAASVTSQELSVAAAALSVRIDTVSNADSVGKSAVVNASTTGSIAALSFAIANDASVSAAILNAMSVQLGNGQFKVVGNGQTLSTGVFAKLSGLSLSLGAANIYQVEGQINYTGVGGGSTTAVFQLGMSATNQPVYAAFKFIGQPSGPSASSQVSAIQFGGESAICATPSVMFSIRPGVSGTGYQVHFNGVIQGNAGAAAVLKVVGATSTTAAGGCTVRAGSFIKAFRIA